MTDTSTAVIMAREPEDAATPPKKLLRSAAVKSRIGDISSQTLWRYGRDPELGFPKPIYICGVRYWDATEIDAFIEHRQWLEYCRDKSASDSGGAL